MKKLSKIVLGKVISEAQFNKTNAELGKLKGIYDDYDPTFHVLKCDEYESIDYPQALSMLDPSSEVYVLPPSEEFDNYIYIFPASSYDDSDGKLKGYKHKNTIYYKGNWYGPLVFFKNAPDKYKNKLAQYKEDWGCIYYLNCINKRGNYYKFPLCFFNFKTEEHKEFKQKAIQPIRDLLVNFKLISSGIGKGSKFAQEIRKKRTKMIVRIFEAIGGKKSGYIQIIQKRLPVEFQKEFLNNDDLYDKYFDVNDRVIRETLKGRGLI